MNEPETMGFSSPWQWQTRLYLLAVGVAIQMFHPGGARPDPSNTSSTSLHSAREDLLSMQYHSISSATSVTLNPWLHPRFKLRPECYLASWL